jgi:hypothetical protein
MMTPVLYNKQEDGKRFALPCNSPRNMESRQPHFCPGIASRPKRTDGTVESFRAWDIVRDDD